MHMTVRTRIAPSPTGAPHLGTAYVGLMNRVFADAMDGEFVLRIEDTDRARSTRASEEAVINALRWLGLDWNEGPDVGGAHGPYRQSERLDIYHQHVEQLLEAGAAFRCFCTPERLAAMRREQVQRKQTPRYDGACLELSPQAVRARVEAGEPSVVRLEVPSEGQCSFTDLLRGEIEIPWAQVDMQVLLKSDGYPTYHLAACVDDQLMHISHLIRGEEWINSVPKQQLLTRAFGWKTPVHVHLPLIRNPDGSKLSKRRNPTSIDYYRRLGVLPEALLNYLATLGWSMPDESDVFSLAEMRAAFDLSRLGAGAPVFDMVKLKSLNGKYLRALDGQAFLERLLTWANESNRVEAIVDLIRERSEILADVAPQIDYLLGNRAALSLADFDHKKLETERQRDILAMTSWALEGLTDWQRSALYDACKRTADVCGVKFRDFLSPIFLAISGRQVSLPLFDSMVILGRDICLMRMKDAIECLGGLSRKQEESLRREFSRESARP